MIDTHLHAVSFLQRPLEAAALEELLGSALDGVVVFGIPVKKKWGITEPERPTYYLDDNAPCGTYSLTDELVATVVASLSDEARARVAPLICGFDPTDRLAPDHLELMIDRHPHWRGVGEVLLRHDDLTELTYGENARAGHPALDGVLEICADRDWAFTFHQDISSAGRSGQREYLEEVTSMLSRHPRVPQVWAHAGVSRRVHPDDHTSLLDELFAAHSNLHVDLSWVLYDAVVADHGPDAAWVDLVGRHPDRFVLGSDAFGSTDEQPHLVHRWRALTERLPPSAQEAVEGGNARRLWWGR